MRWVGEKKDHYFSKRTKKRRRGNKVTRKYVDLKRRKSIKAGKPYGGTGSSVKAKKRDGGGQVTRCDLNRGQMCTNRHVQGEKKPTVPEDGHHGIGLGVRNRAIQTEKYPWGCLFRQNLE